jgi:hypothetical protein
VWHPVKLVTGSFDIKCFQSLNIFLVTFFPIKSVAIRALYVTTAMTRAWILVNERLQALNPA